MAGAEYIRLQQFEVAAIAAPPALLCQQLLLTGTGQNCNLQQLLRQNPALLLRVLDAQHKLHSGGQSASIVERLASPDAEWLHGLLSDMSLQMVLRSKQCNHLFQQLHWQEARSTALLARLLAERCGVQEQQGAELCALLLDSGKLVLEQKHGAAWVGLYVEINQQRRLLEAERQTLGIDHIEAGVALLQSWQLEQDCIDAVRYQAVTLDEVLDATPLVRLTWLARVLAALTPKTLASAHVAAERLFGLAPADVDLLLQQAQAQLDSELRSWGAPQQLQQQRQISDLEQRRFDQELREELQRLQWQLLSESALLALENLPVSSPDDLRSVLARALQQAAVDPRFLVLATQAGQPRLQVVAGNKVGQVPMSLGLQLAPGRSALADRVLAGELSLLSTDHEPLSVIDRQVLDLLGGSLLCEPVQTSVGRVVLLLAASNTYAQRRLLRAFVKRRLSGFHQQEEQAPVASADSLLYRQRVREAVHEANNPLAIIKNYLQILQMKSGDAGAAKEIRIIHNEIDRVAVILKGLRQEESEPVQAHELDINALLRSLHPVFVQGFGARQNAITIELDLADDPAHVHAHPDALKQILTNLVTNAAEAMADGGNITLATRRNVYQNEALYLQLSVADDGPGIAPAQLARLFVTGNTSKGGDHRGTGLAIVKRLVDEMQGQISCQSDSKGTMISILLPHRPQ